MAAGGWRNKKGSDQEDQEELKEQEKTIKVAGGSGIREKQEKKDG